VKGPKYFNKLNAPRLKARQVICGISPARRSPSHDRRQHSRTSNPAQIRVIVNPAAGAPPSLSRSKPEPKAGLLAMQHRQSRPYQAAGPPTEPKACKAMRTGDGGCSVSSSTPADTGPVARNPIPVEGARSTDLSRGVIPEESKWATPACGAKATSPRSPRLRFHNQMSAGEDELRRAGPVESARAVPLLLRRRDVSLGLQSRFSDLQRDSRID